MQSSQPETAEPQRTPLEQWLKDHAVDLALMELQFLGFLLGTVRQAVKDNVPIELAWIDSIERHRLCAERLLQGKGYPEDCLQPSPNWEMRNNRLRA